MDGDLEREGRLDHLIPYAAENSIVGVMALS